LLSAGYWSLKALLHWLAQEAIKSLPAPENRVLFVITDGSKKTNGVKKIQPPKRGV
jgi:hypothetical protein